MFLLTLGCLGSAGCELTGSTQPVMPATLLAVAVLTLVTVCRRTLRLHRRLASGK
jgi:hypothetical protein